MNRRAKLQILDRLIFIRGKYLKLEFTLELNDEDASAIRNANKRLAKRIDDVRRQLHDDWAGSATKLTSELRAISTRVQTSIRAIEKRSNVPEHIVKAVGYVDRVLELTGRLLNV
jgi:hypothetical protein